LNGSVTIADPHTDNLKRQQICPTTLWSSCAIDDSRAALVSHSATLYVFGLNEFSVLSTLSLGVDQRLFCVCSLNNLIAVGAMDNIFVVKNNIRLPTIVWSCCFFNDIILASGDSRGIVSLWNPRSSALIAVSCSSRIHAAGVDPRIISIKQIVWFNMVCHLQRNGPARDVRAMACYDDKIYAAGEDHDIYVAKDGCQVLINQWNVCSLRMTRGLFFVDLWTNGSSESANSTGDVVMKRQPVYFMDLRGHDTVPCSDLSNDGRILAISTCDSTTVYQINVKSDQTIDLLQKFQTQTASALKIIGNSLFMTTGDFELWQISVNGGELKRILEQCGYGGVAQLAVSYCGRFVAVITTRSQVFVIDVKASVYRSHILLFFIYSLMQYKYSI
uniref:WD_REPEATS_REGION domain-containing protein n=1 Tax=Angiostrongylus cantonensis TaxID=6313 RepID=A0A0K0DIA9_ANGCA